MASNLTFQPYGLIKNRVQEILYRNAHIQNVYSGIANPKEPETVALMEVILYQNTFTGPNFIVTSEQPPNPTSDRRCDIVVKYLDSGLSDIKALCFAECKRTNKTQIFTLKALEKQAREYCELYLQYEEDISFVYAATMAGAHLRLWKCELTSEGWAPFWGSNREGDWREYKDVGDAEDGRMIEGWLEHMKGMPPTPYAGQTVSSYGSTTPTASANYLAPPGYSMQYPGFGSASRPTGGYTVKYPGLAQNFGTAIASGYGLSSTASTGPSAYPGMHMTQLTTAEPTRVTEAPDEDVEDHSDEGDQDEDEDDGEDVEMDEAADLAGPEFKVVKVTKVPRILGHTEFRFKDRKGNRKSTAKSDWSKTSYNGRTAWAFMGRKTTYISLDKIE